MNKQEEIEHIARLIEDCPCDECTFCLRDGRECKGYITARKIIKQGYGDVRAAVREFAGVLRDKIFREHSLGTKGYIVGFKEMKERALADVDALVKEVCSDD